MRVVRGVGGSLSPWPTATAEGEGDAAHGRWLAGARAEGRRPWADGVSILRQAQDERGWGPSALCLCSLLPADRPSPWPTATATDAQRRTIDSTVSLTGSKPIRAGVYARISVDPDGSTQTARCAPPPLTRLTIKATRLQNVLASALMASTLSRFATRCRRRRRKRPRLGVASRPAPSRAGSSWPPASLRRRHP